MLVLLLATLLTVSPEQLLGTTTGDAAIAASQSGYLVAWPEATSRGTQIRIARLDGSGHRSSTAMLPPLSSDATLYATRPAIASNGSDYYVVWEESNDPSDVRTRVAGMRISASGTPIDGTLADFGRWPERLNRPALDAPRLLWRNGRYELDAKRPAYSRGAAALRRARARALRPGGSATP
ncbi:MAG TPA: hypothetical protein VFN10_17390 [Thermoanaerobaculia bacterium]|nr:hypothetical protein [Thermoanaerobaculia bacterium]